MNIASVFHWLMLFYCQYGLLVSLKSEPITKYIWLARYLFVYDKTFHCNHTPWEYSMTGKSTHNYGTSRILGIYQNIICQFWCELFRYSFLPPKFCIARHIYSKSNHTFECGTHHSFSIQFNTLYRIAGEFDGGLNLMNLWLTMLASN